MMCDVFCRSRINGYLQFDWLEHIRYIALSGRSMADQSRILSHTAGPELCGHQFGRPGVFGHHIAVHTVSTLFDILDEQVQAGHQGGHRLSGHLSGIHGLCLAHRAQCVLPRQSANLRTIMRNLRE